MSCLVAFDIDVVVVRNEPTVAESADEGTSTGPVWDFVHGQYMIHRLEHAEIKRLKVHRL